METINVVVKTESDNSCGVESDHHNNVDIAIAKSEIVAKDEGSNTCTDPIAIKQEIIELDDDATECKPEEILFETKIEHDEPVVNIPKKKSQKRRFNKPKNKSGLNGIDANTADERYKCVKCTLIFRSYTDLLHHSNDHDEEKNIRLYHCGYEDCLHVSKTANLLLRHIDVKHGSCRKPFACGICRQKFDTVANFEQHRDSLHQNPWLCNICDKLFGDIAKHYKTKHGDITKPKRPTKSQSGLPVFTPYERANLQTTEAMTYICQICLIDFNDLPEAKYHVNHDHPNLKQRSCEKCGRTFSRRTDMLRHTKTSTSCGNPSLKSRNFPCKFCNKSFPSIHDLNRHAALHADQDPDFTGHVCDLCGKAFTMYAQYEMHINRHKGLKPFKCTGCGKGFSDVSTRNRHEKTGVCPNQMVLCCVDCDEELSGVLELAAHICPGKKAG